MGLEKCSRRHEALLEKRDLEQVYKEGICRQWLVMNEVMGTLLCIFVEDKDSMIV
jgi:hypothetical protein